MLLLRFPILVCLAGAGLWTSATQGLPDPEWQPAFNAGTSAYYSGRYQEAWQYFEAARAATQNLPAGDPRRLVVQIGFALVHQARGERGPAEAIYQEAVAAFSSPAHAKSALLPLALENLGALRLEQSRWLEAEDLTRRAVALFGGLYGDKDVATAKARIQLAQVVATQGKFQDALSLTLGAVPVLRAALPANSPELLRGYTVLGEVYVCLRQYAEAEPWLQEAHNQARTLKPPHPSMAEAASNLGLLFVRLGDIARALPLLRLALQTDEQIHGESHPHSAPFHSALSMAYARDRKYGLAEQHARRAIALAAPSLDEDQMDLARLRSDLGVVLYARGNYVEAERLFRAVLPVTEAHFAPGHPDLFSAHFNLAEACAQLGHSQEASAHYRRAIELSETGPAGLRDERTYAVTRYAGFLKSTHSPEAKHWQDRAKALRSEH